MIKILIFFLFYVKILFINYKLNIKNKNKKKFHRYYISIIKLNNNIKKLNLNLKNK